MLEHLAPVSMNTVERKWKIIDFVEAVFNAVRKNSLMGKVLVYCHFIQGWHIAAV